MPKRSPPSRITSEAYVDTFRSSSGAALGHLVVSLIDALSVTLQATGPFCADPGDRRTQREIQQHPERDLVARDPLTHASGGQEQTTKRTKKKNIKVIISDSYEVSAYQYTWFIVFYFNFISIH